MLLVKNIFSVTAEIDKKQVLLIRYFNAILYGDNGYVISVGLGNVLVRVNMYFPAIRPKRFYIGNQIFYFISNTKKNIMLFGMPAFRFATQHDHKKHVAVFHIVKFLFVPGKAIGSERPGNYWY